MTSSARERLEGEGWAIEAETTPQVWALSRGDERASAHVWCDRTQFERALVMHGPEVGKQLFVIPDLRGEWAEDGVLVTERVDGEPVRDDDFWSQHGASLIAEELGEALRKLHSLTTPTRAFGDAADGGERWSTFNGFAAARLESHLESVNHDATLSPEQRDELLRAMDDLRHELSAFHPRYPAVWCHGAPGAHALYTPAEGRQLTALCGFGHSMLLPGEWDLACALFLDGLIEHDRLVRSFYRGYGAARTMDMQRRERFFRRLVALEALYGELPSRADRDALIGMVGPHA